MIDVGFPVIKYERGASPNEWGRLHGETYREAIHELVEIRTGLMREKNSGLTDDAIKQLATEQWEATRKLDQALFDEIQGIAEGANLSIEAIVIVNNYTDFRDIEVADQGCSMVFVNESAPIAGQTWDMHGSAKNYVCVIDVEGPADRQIVFSLVGCVGMMGYSSSGTMIGVNNINTDGARPGAMWPAIVRKTLQQNSLATMRKELTSSPVTSGHNYLIADQSAGEMWEVMPDLSEKVLDSTNHSRIFHTNHCLGEQAQLREHKLAHNSTTYERYDLIKKKIDSLTSFEDVYGLLNDHENYPRSICSNFQSDSQDPSVTCGGAIGNLQTGQVKMWRGDELYDDNFVRHQFQLEPGE